jgi:hypothetical protein
MATPEGTVLLPPEAPLEALELLVEPHPASTADAARNAAHGISQSFLVSLIGHASRPFRSTAVA